MATSTGASGVSASVAHPTTNAADFTPTLWSRLPRGGAWTGTGRADATLNLVESRSRDDGIAALTAARNWLPLMVTDPAEPTISTRARSTLPDAPWPPAILTELISPTSPQPARASAERNSSPE